MKFTPTDIAGLLVIEIEPIADERGNFARSFCKVEFLEAGLGAFAPVQMNISRNVKMGTLRGMHYQDEPTPDPKVVRCTRGRVYDVAVDLRPDSTTFCEWFGLELTADRQNALYVPPGCAHGFITLEDDSEVFYVMGAPYVPELARGVRWDDPAFGVHWPIPPVTIAARDAEYPDFKAPA